MWFGKSSWTVPRSLGVNLGLLLVQSISKMSHSLLIIIPPLVASSANMMYLADPSCTCWGARVPEGKWQFLSMKSQEWCTWQWSISPSDSGFTWSCPCWLLCSGCGRCWLRGHSEFYIVLLICTGTWMVRCCFTTVLHLKGMIVIIALDTIPIHNIYIIYHYYPLFICVWQGL